MPITLRPAGPADAEALAVLLDGFAMEIGACPGFAAAERARDSLRAQPLLRTLLAEREGGAGKATAQAGFVMWTPAFDPVAGTAGATIAALYVLPALRRRGIGRRLMAAVARATKGSGGRYIAWATARNAMAARMFYDGIGAPHPTTIIYSAQGEAFIDLAGEE